MKHNRHEWRELTRKSVMTRPRFFVELKDEDRAIRQHSSTNTRGVFLHSKFAKVPQCSGYPKHAHLQYITRRNSQHNCITFTLCELVSVVLRIVFCVLMRVTLICLYQN